MYEQVGIAMYWEKCGQENTKETVSLAVKRAEELDIKRIVVASNTGKTALACSEVFDGEIICVTHHVGFSGPGADEMPAEQRALLSAKGIRILTTTHLMAGLDRAVRNKFGGLYPAELIAASLRMLGQGVKVCVEVAGMALDAGLVPYGEEIITIGGTGSGADTAIVVLPAHSNNFFETKIKEIICKPREF